jgi:hypothetical protein
VFNIDEARAVVGETDDSQPAPKSFIVDGVPTQGWYFQGKYFDSQMNQIKGHVTPIAPGASQEGISGLRRETPSNRDDVRKENEATANMLGETAIALRRNRNAPGAAGFRGAAQEFVEGTVGQVPGVGEPISEFAEEMTGVDATELAAIRTQGRVLVARMITTITGEESGRYTQQEQELARKTEGQLDLLKTADQIEGALSELQSIKLRGEMRTRGAEFIKDVTGESINILTDEGYQKWGNKLVNQFGLRFEDAVIELDRHVEIMSRK